MNLFTLTLIIVIAFIGGYDFEKAVKDLQERNKET